MPKVRVTVHGARHLPKMDIVGAGDPYCHIIPLEPPRSAHVSRDVSGDAAVGGAVHWQGRPERWAQRANGGALNKTLPCAANVLKQQTTPVCSNTSAPVWNYDCKFALPSAECGLRFELWDQDAITPDEPIGCCWVFLNHLRAGEPTKMNLTLWLDKEKVRIDPVTMVRKQDVVTGDNVPQLSVTLTAVDFGARLPPNDPGDADVLYRRVGAWWDHDWAVIERRRARGIVAASSRTTAESAASTVVPLRETFEKAAVWFRVYDRDGSGTIDMSELPAVLRAMGFAPSNAECQRIMRLYDENKDSTLGLAEFRVLVAAEGKRLPEATPSDAEMFSAFEAFDEDGSGTVSVEELLSALQASGERLSGDEVRAIRAKVMAVTTSTELSFPEFKKVFGAMQRVKRDSAVSRAFPTAGGHEAGSGARHGSEFAPTTGAGNEAANRARLERYLAKKAPEHVSHADAILRAHRGREADMWRGLQQKYGGVP